jgi:hypothetical protein
VTFDQFRENRNVYDVKPGSYNALVTWFSRIARLPLYVEYAVCASGEKSTEQAYSLWNLYGFLGMHGGSHGFPKP